MVNTNLEQGNCLANLIAFSDERTSLVGEVRVVKVVYLDLSKVFNTHDCKTLRKKID